MKKILILLAFAVCTSFFFLNSSSEVRACFGCECTNSCGGSAP